MKIAILHPSYEGSNAPFKNLDPLCDPSRYLPGPAFSHFHIAKATAVRQVTEVVRQGFDAIINLCDGARDEDRAGLEVVQTLELHNAAFTGAGAAFYEPSREAMKMACQSVGVAFPAYVMARAPADVQRAVAHLRFPMIVKHPNGYSSVGLTRESVVHEAESLQREVTRISNEYGAALVEEFIAGREFTVLVAEPRDDTEEAWALAPVEFLFPAGETFKHFDLKWVNHHDMETREVEDARLALRLREASALAFAALGGSGYARADLRLDAAGEIYLLELNPYCGVFYPDGEFGSTDFILAKDPAGHRGFLEHLLARALRRRDQAKVPWELRYRRAQGFGLFAREALAPGVVVERFEERPHVLASRRHLEQNWQGRKRRLFAQYAWPISSELYVLWSGNPDQWHPINHSCDPNTWLHGLDLVVRRHVAVGEELTVDYATFCGPSMEAFDCRCGAAECRGRVHGTDYLLPALQMRYGEHVSDFVRSAWHRHNDEAGPPHELVRNSFGLGVVARRAWRAGEVISVLSWGGRQATPSRWTVQCGDDEHAEPLPAELRFISHSCVPNVMFDVEQGVVRALADIAPGAELSHFYPATEWEMAERFECQCGTAACHGLISGAAALPPEILERYTLSGVIRRKVAAKRQRGGPGAEDRGEPSPESLALRRRIDEVLRRIDLPDWLARWRQMQGGATREYHIQRLVQTIPFDGPRVRVLDLCCGPGDLGRAVGQRFPQAEVDFIDRDPFLLAVCSAANARLAVHGRVMDRDIWSGDWCAGVNGPYHAVLLANALHWFNHDRLVELFREVRNLLVPGGSFAFLEPVSPVPTLAAYDQRWLQNAHPGLAEQDNRLWNEFWAGLAKDLGLDYYAQVTARLPPGRHYGDDNGLHATTFIDLLNRAGFRTVDILARDAQSIVVAAIR